MTTANTREAWARELVRRGRAGGPLTRYGSAEWCALGNCPEKVAAVVVAAEAWWRHCTPAQIEADLRASLREIEAVLARRQKLGSWDISEGADWRAIAALPTFAELQTRRYGSAA